jgi:hypothetical protein
MIAMGEKINATENKIRNEKAFSVPKIENMTV